MHWIVVGYKHTFCHSSYFFIRSFLSFSRSIFSKTLCAIPNVSPMTILFCFYFPCKKEVKNSLPFNWSLTRTKEVKRMNIEHKIGLERKYQLLAIYLEKYYNFFFQLFFFYVSPQTVELRLAGWLPTKGTFQHKEQRKKEEEKGDPLNLAGSSSIRKRLNQNGKEKFNYSFDTF